MKTSNKLLLTATALYLACYAVAAVDIMRKANTAHSYATELTRELAARPMRTVLAMDTGERLPIDTLATISNGILALREIPAPENCRIEGDTLYLATRDMLRRYAPPRDGEYSTYVPFRGGQGWAKKPVGI